MPNSEVVSVLTAEFLTTGQVAALLGITKKALADLRVKRSGPPFMLIARGAVVYPRTLFQVYLRQRQNRAHPAIPNLGRVRQSHTGG